MKSIVRAIAIAAAFAAVGSTASAQTASLTNASVAVSVTLTPKCKWTTTAPTGLAVAFGTYVAFQNDPLVPAAPATFSVTCSRSYSASPTVTWDTTDAESTAAGVGVLHGLQYSLSVTGGAASGGVEATSSSIGQGDNIVYTLSGSMPGGQAGTVGASGTQTRQLTMTF